jgi:serralysin
MGRTITLTDRNDTFVQGGTFNNVGITINALSGDDIIRLNRTDDSGGRNTVSAGSGNDLVSNLIEDGSNIFLGLGNDTYVGAGFGSFIGELPDTVRGGDGSDTFILTTFRSDYFGGAGDDTFFSEGERNTISGGAGVDTVSYRTRGENSVNGATAVTINLQTQRVETGPIAVEFLSSIENAEGSVKDDVIIGSTRANSLTGGGGLDALQGGAGADRFIYTRVSDAAAFSDVAEEIVDFSRSEGDRIDLRRIDADASVAGNQAFVFRGQSAFSGDQHQLRFAANGPNQVVIQGDRTGDGIADFQILLDGVTTLRGADFLL